MRRLLAVVMGAALLMAGLPGPTAGSAPAGVTPPPPFDPRFDKLNVSVTGTYKPLIGDFDCDADPGDHGAGSQEVGILWYAPGVGADTLWTDLTRTGGVLGRTARSLTISGSYTPLVGDFDGDRCDDILWYGVGTAPDNLWWGGPSGFTSQAINIAGTYRPFVGFFGVPPSADGIFWYAPNGAESVWVPRGTRATPFTTALAPQVGYAHYRPAWFWLTFSGTPLILWHAPGGAADHIWRYTANASGPTGFTDEGADAPVVINGDHRVGGCGPFVVLHGPGSAPDYAAWRNFGVQYSKITISGSYTIATTPGYEDCNIVWHGPGSAPDQIWLQKQA